LAPPCPNNEKAFVNQTFGKMLDINFNSENLSWQYPHSKSKKALELIDGYLKKLHLNLEIIQKLVGRLNDFLQL
jgi:hypothetical protein